TYIRYTYDVSNRILGYVVGIIVIVGFIIGRFKPLEAEGDCTVAFLPNPSTIAPEEANLFGFIFLVLFLAGLCLHAFFVFQRIIVDRQVKVIDRVRQYFIDQAKSRKVDLERYLYILKAPIPQGPKDCIAQTRLMLPAFVNGVTGTLAFMYFKNQGWNDLWLMIGIFVVLLVLHYWIINQWAYSALVKQVAPEI
ncbi:MAG: hypothetical protein ACREYC_18075, partial [Gammaproteobacteria bacterium]